MRTPSAYPAHNPLAFLMLSSTRPATSTRSAYVLASAARTGIYDGDSDLDAQNFGSNCTTAIRAPEMRFEDMMVFGDVLQKRDTTWKPRMVVVTEQEWMALSRRVDQTLIVVAVLRRYRKKIETWETI